MITPENEMKWDTMEPNQGDFRYGRADEIVNWARARGMRVRGHTLVWWNPDANQLPDWVKNLPPNQLRAAMENHITNVVSHYRGQLYAIDVVNEPFNDDGSFRNHWFYNAMGVDYIAIALRAARAADPNVKLYLNDYNIEANNTAKSNAMYNLVSSLKNQGVPLDGVGFESHFEVGRPPSGFQDNLARFAALNVDVAITEWDDRMRVTDTNSQTPVDSNDLNRQATEAADAVRACLNVPRCVGFSQWAVGDRDSWVPLFPPFQNPAVGAATLFDVNYNAKPAYHSVLSALGGSPPTTPPTTPPPSSGGSTSFGAYVWLIGAQSNRCLDVPSGGGDGTQLQLWDCHGGSNQAYLLHADGSIRVQDKCLDVPTGASAGSKMQIWGCSGQPNQQWTLNTNGTLRSTSTTMCIDADGAGTGNGTKIILWSCTASANQKWGFSTRAIIGNPSGRCLDAPQGGGNATQMQLWDCGSGNVNQALTLTADGELRVRGKCLDMPTGGNAGAKLQIWDCSGQPNQKWVLANSGRIINPASGMCIDASGGGTANSTKVVLWTCTGASNQLWHM